MPCKAIQISEDSYQIIENEDIDLDNDPTSIWEFFPGDIVKCRLKDDLQSSTEEILVAEDLITLSPSWPNRKVYQLIFLIVGSLGNIKITELDNFKDEIKELCNNKSIIQRNHPIVKKWLQYYCEL